MVSRIVSVTDFESGVRRVPFNIEEGVKKPKSRQKRNQARKDGSLGGLWTCLRVAPPPEALRRAGASAKAGPNLLKSTSSERVFQVSFESETRTIEEFIAGKRTHQLFSR
jgi:hypothetical protein